MGFTKDEEAILHELIDERIMQKQIKAIDAKYSAQLKPVYDKYKALYNQKQVEVSAINKLHDDEILALKK